MDSGKFKHDIVIQIKEWTDLQMKSFFQKSSSRTLMYAAGIFEKANHFR